MNQAGAIGLIGLGAMGGLMVQHLLDAGRSVNIFARKRQNAEKFVQAGARWFDSAAHLARNSGKIITIVGTPHDVKEIYLGPDGLIDNARPGTYLIDMTTSSPELARHIFQKALNRGVHALDAPVTGGVSGARNAKLTIMVGGSRSALEAVRVELDILGSRIFWMGPAGSGQITKICNQLGVAGIMLGMAEAIHFARNSGVSPDRIFEVLKSGTAYSTLLERVGPKMIKGDEDAGFFLSHFIKDLEIAAQTGSKKGLEFPAAMLCQQLYQTIARDGGDKKGIQALLEAYDNGQGKNEGIDSSKADA